MRVFISRLINRLLGGNPDELFCARVYANHRERGGVWTLALCVLDTLFACQEDQHCRRCYIWEKRYARTTEPTS
jgi:hypothetical protein